MGKQQKGGKRVNKKKQYDPLSRKEWFDFQSPAPFAAKPFGKTLVTKTTGTKIASEEIKGRVVEMSLADLRKEKNNENAFKKFKLIIDEVEGSNAKTTFYGLNTTKEKLNNSIKKWITLIDIYCDVKTVDGYFLRVFLNTFTQRQKGQLCKTSYAQDSQVKQIRRIAVKTVTDEVSKLNINQLIQRLISDDISTRIYNQAKKIYPLKEVLIRKIKVLKRPKIDAVKLKEMYTYETKGREQGIVGEAEDSEAQNKLTQKA